MTNFKEWGRFHIAGGTASRDDELGRKADGRGSGGNGEGGGC